MNEHIGATPPGEVALQRGFETRSQQMFLDSVADVEMPVRSRLTQARHAALDAAALASRKPWFLRSRVWTPAAGATAAVLIGAALWLSPGNHGIGPVDGQPNLEDLDIVASSDGSGDAIEMLQNDLDFYDFAEKAENPEPAA